MKKFLAIALTVSAFSAGTAFSSTTYDGITFPQGDVSFADKVISLIYPGDPDTAGIGDPTPFNPLFTDGDSALGPPDYDDQAETGAVSLGAGGTLILQFVDNVLTGSGDSIADLHIFEVGSDVEDTFVAISQNGVDWIDVGEVTGGTKSLDIDPALELANLASDTEFRFVRLIDEAGEGQTGNSSSGTVGADIDAVGAITTVATPVPLPAAAWLMIAGIGGLAALRRNR